MTDTNNSVIENMVTLSGEPYFDRFDSDQNRTMLLYNHDRPLQSSELNEQQSIFSYYLGTLGNMIANDGDKQEGMDVIQDGLNVTVKAGKVYLAGKVRSFSEQTVAITGVGMEHIGIRLAQKVITAQMDSSLNDPSESSASANSAGADRLEETVLLVANDPAAATLYTFNDGTLFLETKSSMLSKVEDIVANHTYNSFGSYQIGQTKPQAGFDMSVDGKSSDPTNYARLSISQGLAYVRGYEVNKPYTSYLPVRKATDTETITDEQHTYVAGTNTYTLNFPDVSTITTVSAQVQTTVAINHGTANGMDYVTDDVISIDKVYTEGTGGVTYNPSSDYLVSGNSIDWSPKGNEPSLNTSYMVQVTYNVVLTQGKDYSVNNDNQHVNGVCKLTFGLQGSNLAPKVGGVFTTTYDHYLYRADLITIDKHGSFAIHEGKPARLAYAAPLVINDPNTLTLGYVLMFPNATVGSCTNSAVTNLTFTDLNDLKARVVNLEYNQVITSLDTQELQNSDTAKLRGIFTDTFTSASKYDGGYNNTSTGTADPIVANVLFSFDNSYITTARDEANQKQNILKIDPANSTAVQQGGAGTQITAPYNEVNLITQQQTTGAISVNPYEFYGANGKLTLSPREDQWIDTKVVNVTDTLNGTIAPSNVDRWWATITGNGWGNAKPYDQSVWGTSAQNIAQAEAGMHTEAESNRIALDYEFDTSDDSSYTTTGGYGDWGTHLKSRRYYTDNIKRSAGSYYTDTQAQYMDTKTITIHATGLPPQSDNYALTFGGITCSLTPASGFYAGSTVSGSLKANPDGEVQGTFTIPSNVPCGTVSVVLTNGTYSATSSYTASGINRTVENISVKYTTEETVSHYAYDPVAQTFQTAIDCSIRSLDLLMGSKDSTVGLHVQVRKVSNTGEPTDIVLDNEFIPSSSVNVSANGEANWTHVTLTNPIEATAGDQFAIIVIADSPNYTVWRAKMGKKETKTGQVIATKAYNPGIMFESSNSSYWTGDQDSSMAFQVNVASYTNQNSIVQFKPVTGLNADQLVLLATCTTPSNTDVVWEYKDTFTTNTKQFAVSPWKALNLFSLTNLQGNAKGILVRATLKAKQYVSPTIESSGLTLGTFVSLLKGDYVSLNIDSTNAPFNTIKLSYLQALPPTASARVIPGYSLDGGGSWNTFTATPTITQANVTYQKVQYVQTIGSTAKQIKFHLRLSTNYSYMKPLVKQLVATWSNQ